MKQTLSTGQAAGLLLDDNNAGWSYEGAYALCEHLESVEDGENEIEFDRVALRCEFSEYTSGEDWADQYWRDNSERDRECSIDQEVDGTDALEEKIMEYIMERTCLVQFDGGIIIQDF